MAVCLFPGVTVLDFTGPMELFSFLYPNRLARSSFGPSPYTISATYLSISKEPVVSTSELVILPNKTYGEAVEQYDILVVPGGASLFTPRCSAYTSLDFAGPGSRPDVCPKSLVDFIVRQTPGAKYVFSVCTGSEVLAQAGILEGKRATTNKSSFNRIKGSTQDRAISWVAKARWVVDGKIWTSSGVTAGEFVCRLSMGRVLIPAS